MPVYLIESIEIKPRSTSAILTSGTAGQKPTAAAPAAVGSSGLEAHAQSTSPALVATGVSPDVQRSVRYARDARDAIRELNEEHRQPISLKPLRVVRGKRETHVAEKKEIYHRLTHAMRHRGFVLATSATQLKAHFTKNSRAHRDARSFLDTCCKRKLSKAMAMHPQMFTESEIEAMLVSTNERETLAMLERTTGDQFKMAKDLSSVLAMPIVNFFTLIGAVIFMLLSVIPSIVRNIFPYASEIPPFLQWMVNASNFLHDPRRLAILSLLLAIVAVGGMMLWRTVPGVRMFLAILVMYHTRAYGRLKHAIERRTVFNTMIHLLHAGRITDLFARCAKVAGPAGESALMRASHAKQEGSNPMTRIRHAQPYISVQEGEAIIAGYAESGVSGCIAEIGHAIENIDDDRPRISEAMKREISVTSSSCFGAALAFFFLGLANAVVTMIFHLHLAGVHPHP